MISTLGLMLGGYMIFRFVEVASRSASQFSSPRAQNVVRLMALLGVLVTGFLLGNIVHGGLGALSVRTAVRCAPASGPEDGGPPLASRAQ